jgi:hypothetical protein
MPTINERLLDRAIDHAIDLQRFSNGVVRRIIATLNSFDTRLVEQIANALLRVDADSVSIQRLEELLASARELNAQAYRGAYGLIPDAMRDLTAYEVDWQTNTLRASFPADVRARIVFNRLTIEQVYASVVSRPFQGGLRRDWPRSGEEGRMALVRNAIRQGFLEGPTTDQIVRKIRGTRALQFKDGLLERSRRSVETMVRTALSHTAGTARGEVFTANADVIKAEKWVSVLDGRTSVPCRIRDGLQYTPKTHKPVGHKIPWLQGPGRLHFGCRSTSAPVTKSLRELGLDVEDFSPSTRASVDGAVPADQTFGQWLQRQSAARQDEIVGPTRGALMRRGGLPFDELYTARGDYVSLEELRRRDAEAFRRAGL